MARHKNVDWDLPEVIGTWERVNTAILLDIRDELKRLNNLLHCQNFIAIPRILKTIRSNTTKPIKKTKLKVVRRRAA